MNSVPRRSRMASTHWTEIRSCARTDSVGQAAREGLCREYWYPIYAYIKRLGHLGTDAEDLTQDFFAYILNKPWFERADRSKGRFRSFLVASLDHFLHDQIDSRKARKRGGDYQHIPLDMGSAESRYAQGSQANLCPTDAYEIEWASRIVGVALTRLENEYSDSDKAARFHRLKTYLTADGDAVGYETVARELGMAVGNIKVCVHRLRKRYGELLREEVARTVASTEDVAEEVQHIIKILAADAGAAA